MSKKTGIRAVPFDLLEYDFKTEKGEEWFNKWITEHKIKQCGSFIYPQLRAYLATFELNSAGVDGTISGTQFWRDNIDTKDPWMLGMVRFILLDTPRGSTLKDQNKEDGRNFSALVPIVLSAFKFSQDIPYSKWERRTLNQVVDPQLLEAMLHESEYPDSEDYFVQRFGFTTEELLEVRQRGMLVLSGKTAGKVKDPRTATGITNVTLPGFAKMPRLTKIMATQIWCAHPVNRNKYAVLDPLDWDSTPPNLAGDDTLFVSTADTHSDVEVPLSRPNFSWLP